jgi:4a-hydroxytetrahydrobiopterin dehydratase
MEQDINTFIANHSEWRLIGDTLVRDWKLADFSQIRQVVSQLCDLADELDHHPTVTFGYNTLHVETTTHDDGNQVTAKDLELAARVNKLVGE